MLLYKSVVYMQIFADFVALKIRVVSISRRISEILNEIHQ